MAAEEFDDESGEEVRAGHQLSYPLPGLRQSIAQERHSVEEEAKTPFPPSHSQSRSRASVSTDKSLEGSEEVSGVLAEAEENGGEEEAAFRRQYAEASVRNEDSAPDKDVCEEERAIGSAKGSDRSVAQKGFKGFFGSQSVAEGEEDDLAFPAVAAPPASETFRRRRLTFAMQGNIPPHTPLSQVQQRVFRSLEIGDVPKVPLPFREGQVGTFSCHGIEPSYLDTRPFVAKINQDRGICVYPFAGHERMALFAVFDGHGEQGDKVSEFCMYEIPRALEAHSSLKGGDDNMIHTLKESFLTVDSRLNLEVGIDAFFSGTTAVACLVKGKRLWVANAGDSRCTLATADPAGTKRLLARDLSTDQNPDSPGEMARIIKNGGYVSPSPEPGLSARVWLDPEYTQVGLAMARSIGDRAVKGVGVVAEPEVVEYSLAEDGSDKFLLLASDGVWEFISSQEAVDIVNAHLEKGVSAACQVLIEQAAGRWRDVEGDYRDDITALLIMLPLFK